MSLFPLKPKHKPVKGYYAALAQFQKHGHTTEGNARACFADLRKMCDSRYAWHLVEECTSKGTAKQSLRADGALIDYLTIQHGIWEAKDSDDDLQKEMKSKIAEGYRLDNILFQSPARAALTPRQIMTRQSLDNAIASVCASGGSTNTVLHLLAVASELNLPLTMDDFDQISARTPLICNLQPGGHYVAKDYQQAGGSRVLAQRLLERGQLHNTPTVSGKTLHEEAALAQETKGQQVILPWSAPLKPTGDLVILKGNLAPEGCVVKVAGDERNHHTGVARVFDSEDACFHAVEAGLINPNDILVIRYEGPRGGAGMREMLAVTAAIKGIPELSKTVALLTDGRLRETAQKSCYKLPPG